MDPLAFPRYEQYKPSGFDWLGDIPDTWSIERIRAVTDLKSKKNQPGLPVLSVYREYGVILKDSRVDNHNATSLDTSNYKVVESGDLVVNKMKAWQGSMGVSEHQGIVSPAYITCAVDSERIHPKFLHYLLRSKLYIGVYNSLSYGVRVGQWDMHYEDFKHIPLPIPTTVEQQRIANFLDQKTAEIDEAIAKKQRLIELLKEQKTILINQAVTKGLNPDAPMQDSEVEWIGNIPAHWEVLHLRNVAKSVKTGKTPPSTLSVDVFQDGNIDWFTPGDFEEKSFLNHAARKVTDYPVRKRHIELFEANSLYFIGIGGTLGKVAVCRHAASCNQQINVISFNEKMLPDYCLRLLKGWREIIFSLTNYTTMPILNQSGTKGLVVIVPPMVEQKEIVSIVQEIEDSNSAVVDKVLNEISLLRELKVSLIAEVVTGKIKL